MNKNAAVLSDMAKGFGRLVDGMKWKRPAADAAGGYLVQPPNDERNQAVRPWAQIPRLSGGVSGFLSLYNLTRRFYRLVAQLPPGYGRSTSRLAGIQNRRRLDPANRTTLTQRATMPGLNHRRCEPGDVILCYGLNLVSVGEKIVKGAKFLTVLPAVVSAARTGTAGLVGNASCNHAARREMIQ